MPEGYVRMRDTFIRKGMSMRAARRKAAAIWNSRHPDNPVTRSETKPTARRKGRD